MQSLGDVLREAGFGPLLERVAPAALEPAPPGEADRLTLCARCGDVGWLRRDVAAGHPDFGKLVECSCEIGQAREARRRERIFGETKIPPRFRKATLDSLAKRYPELAEGCRKWTPSRWLVMHGPKGSCKTGAAAALANAYLVEHGEGSVLFLQPDDFLDRVRETYSDPDGLRAREVIQSLVDAPLLVLDDVGSTQLTDWAKGQLFRVIDGRWSRHAPHEGSLRPTIVTTNLTLPRLAGLLDAEGRTFDRIRDGALRIETQGTSRRGQVRLPYADDRDGELPF